MTVDNPGVFSNIVGDDLYVNPWWALRKINIPRVNAFVECMDRTLGPPDLWFTGLFHELLWGPRHLPRSWRPGFHANLSGHNGVLWRTFWLPWRAGRGGKSLTWTDHEGMEHPFAANVTHFDIDFEKDVICMEAYAQKVMVIEPLVIESEVDSNVK